MFNAIIVYKQGCIDRYTYAHHVERPSYPKQYMNLDGGEGRAALVSDVRGMGVFSPLRQEA